MDFEKMRAIRKEKRKSQDDLAKYLKINRATVSKYETGVIEPSLSQIARIAEFLGTRIEDLVGITEFNSGAEFDAEWKRITQNSNGPSIEIQHKADGTRVLIDPQKIHWADIPYISDDEPELRVIYEAFTQLNAKGQQVAVERIEELTKIPDYQRTEAPEDK